MQYDKRALYSQIENQLYEFGLDNNSPADIFYIVKKEEIEVYYHPFESNSIGAVLYKDSCSAMLVNGKKPLFDQRFDIAHELVHYWLHPCQTSFSLDKLDTRDKEKEWQANEGAAELLLPYKDFIPRFIKTARYTEENFEPLENIYSALSVYYRVNPIVVDYRIRNLENEILQYFNGTPINKIIITRSNIRLNKDKQPVLYKSLINKLNHIAD